MFLEITIGVNVHDVVDRLAAKRVKLPEIHDEKFQDSVTDGVGSHARLEFYDSNSRIGWIGDGNASYNVIDIWSGAANGIIRLATGGVASSNERIRITSDGLVGISTTIPNSNCKLDVQGLGSFTSGVSTLSGQTIYMGSNAGLFTSGGSMYIFDAHGNTIDLGDLKN